MTLDDQPYSQSYGQIEDRQSDAIDTQDPARVLEFTDQLAGITKYWKLFAIGAALVISVAVAEWFVTYCAFSNRCPVVERIGDWPLDKLKLTQFPHLIPPV